MVNTPRPESGFQLTKLSCRRCIVQALRYRRATATVNGSAGFTLLEVLVVISIVVTLTAITLPSILTAVAHVKIRGAASSLAGLIQSSRMGAVKRNKIVTLHFVTIQDVPFAVIKDAEDTSVDLKMTDPQVQLGGSAIQIAVPTTDPPVLTDAILSYTPQSLPDLLSFNPHGLPCKYAAGLCTLGGFVYYVRDIHGIAWTAVSVSPGGRVKQWFWNGKAWTD
jgi:prepilin-type N-terminal cleavage/methylation domain-containing protein